MPGRKVILANGEIYHVLNRGVASQPIFLNKRDYQRTFATFSYYQYKNPPLKYSLFIVQSKEKQLKILNRLRENKKLLVEMIAFCLMPNHFHFLLKQNITGGIAKFISNFTNSYTRYFNTKNERNGPLLQGKFKAVHIETDEQLLHVARYIHLNPYTSYVLKNINCLEYYPYSSFPEYLGKIPEKICNKEYILSHFKNTEDYKKFIFNQADYQRRLGDIKHIILD